MPVVQETLNNNNINPHLRFSASSRRCSCSATSRWRCASSAAARCSRSAASAFSLSCRRDACSRRSPGGRVDSTGNRSGLQAKAGYCPGFQVKCTSTLPFLLQKFPDPCMRTPLGAATPQVTLAALTPPLVRNQASTWTGASISTDHFPDHSRAERTSYASSCSLRSSWRDMAPGDSSRGAGGLLKSGMRPSYGRPSMAASNMRASSRLTSSGSCGQGATRE